MAAVPPPTGGPADATAAAVAATAPVGAAPPLPPTPGERARLIARLATHFDALRPTVHRPPAGILTAPWTTPGGYYNQLWDWDGFFIGVHLAHEGAPEHLVHLVTKCVCLLRGGLGGGPRRGADRPSGSGGGGSSAAGLTPAGRVDMGPRRGHHTNRQLRSLRFALFGLERASLVLVFWLLVRVWLGHGPMPSVAAGDLPPPTLLSLWRPDSGGDQLRGRLPRSGLPPGSAHARRHPRRRRRRSPWG